MAWPNDDLETTHFDAGADNPSLARPVLKRLIDVVKALIGARGSGGRGLRARRQGQGPRRAHPAKRGGRRRRARRQHQAHRRPVPLARSGLSGDPPKQETDDTYRYRGHDVDSVIPKPGDHSY